MLHVPWRAGAIHLYKDLPQPSRRNNFNPGKTSRFRGMVKVAEYSISETMEDETLDHGIEDRRDVGG